MTKIHPSIFEYLKPTDQQIATMSILREAAAVYATALDDWLPDGADKAFILRAHRANAMWANVAITREADGTPVSRFILLAILVLSACSPAGVCNRYGFEKGTTAFSQCMQAEWLGAQQRAAILAK